MIVPVKLLDYGGKRAMVSTSMGLMIIFYAFFIIFPIIYSFAGSFFNWNPMNGQFNYTGIDNYVNIFKDALLWQSLVNTIYFMAVVVVLRTAAGLVLAVMINSISRYKSFFRTAYFIPVITSIVAASMVWKWLYDPTFGAFNFLLSSFGLKELDWLKDEHLALPSIMLTTMWKDVGYSIVVYLAGLAGIPKVYYEASCIDGAHKLQAFWHITIPMLQSTTIFVVIVSVIGYLQTFTQIFMMTNGGPGTSTYTMVFMLYDDAFNKYQFGVASSISFILFIIILFFSLVQMKIMKKDWGY